MATTHPSVCMSTSTRSVEGGKVGGHSCWLSQPLDDSRAEVFWWNASMKKVMNWWANSQAAMAREAKWFKHKRINRQIQTTANSTSMWHELRHKYFEKNKDMILLCDIQPAMSANNNKVSRPNTCYLNTRHLEGNKKKIYTHLWEKISLVLRAPPQQYSQSKKELRA